MNVTGVIAEYNPFHNGHLYHLRESARLTESDYIIVVISGNFVQRGAPALADKRIRTQAALCCGADLVLELPALYAASSAEYFATGAVALLDRLNVVTHLCFGSEWGDDVVLRQIAEILCHEPAWYRSALQASLRQGFPYPAARVRALKESGNPALPGDCAAILSSPNNILGIEYIRALYRRNSPICPVTFRRTGAGYHDIVLPEISDLPQSDVGPENALSGQKGGKHASAPSAVEYTCSALSLRQALYQGKKLTDLSPYMPPEAVSLLTEYLQTHRPLRSDDFSSVLYYKLIAEKESGYAKYLDVSPELSDRIRKHLRFYTGFEAFCDLLKTKNMTHTRISRSLLHILLGMEKKDLELGKEADYVPYARVLGFRRQAAPLLRAIRQRSCLPFVTGLANARKEMSPEAERLMRLDILASELYRNLARADAGRPILNEISTPPVML